MKINKQVFLTSLFVLVLPTTGATLVGSGADVGIQVNSEVTEDSSGRDFVSISNVMSSVSALALLEATQAVSQACMYHTI